jgi:hypothetical protein
MPARISFAACDRFRLRFRSAMASLATRGFPACISRRPCGFEFIGFAGLALRLPFAFDYIPIHAGSRYAYGLRWAFSVFDDCLRFRVAISSISLTAGIGNSTRIQLAILTYNLSLHLPSGLRFWVLRSCCDRCAPFTTAFSTLYSRLPIGLASLDYITDFKASNPILFFRCWPAVRLRALS